MAPPPLSQLVAVASLQLTLTTSSVIPVQDNSSTTGPGEESMNGLYSTVVCIQFITHLHSNVIQGFVLAQWLWMNTFGIFTQP